MAGLADILQRLFGAPSCRVPPAQVPHTPAFQTMRRYNPHGLIGAENDGSICMIEDWSDPDGRMYRLEYQSTPDGRHAVGWCRHNPWGPVSEIHTTNGGLICVGSGAHGPSPASSRYDLATVIQKSRFWCTAVSVYHETGRFPNP